MTDAELAEIEMLVGPVLAAKVRRLRAIEKAARLLIENKGGALRELRAALDGGGG